MSSHNGVEPCQQIPTSNFNPIAVSHCTGQGSVWRWRTALWCCDALWTALVIWHSALFGWYDAQCTALRWYDTLCTGLVMMWRSAVPVFPWHWPLSLTMQSGLCCWNRQYDDHPFLRQLNNSERDIKNIIAFVTLKNTIIQWWEKTEQAVMIFWLKSRDMGVAEKTQIKVPLALVSSIYSFTILCVICLI